MEGIYECIRRRGIKKNFAHFFIVLPAIEWLEGQYEKSVVK